MIFQQRIFRSFLLLLGLSYINTHALAAAIELDTNSDGNFKTLSFLLNLILPLMVNPPRVDKISS